MSNELSGLCVLNTRPKKQAQALTQALVNLGAQVIELPLLEIIPTNTDWKKNLPDLTACHQMIFTSPNAVHYFFTSHPTSLPKNLKIIAIGQGTQFALHHQKIAVDYLPLDPRSEGLLALDNLQKIKHQTILLIKGEKGLEHLPKTLKDRGANLIEVNVYKRIFPKNLEKIAAKIWQEKKIDIILITSQESMENLFRLFDKERQWLTQIPWLTLSARLLEKAMMLGVENTVLSRPDNMIETLINFNKGLKDE